MDLCLSGLCLGQPSLGVTQISAVKGLVSHLQLLELWWPVRALIFCQENEELWARSFSDRDQNESHQVEEPSSDDPDAEDMSDHSDGPSTDRY